jgi:acyl-CoA reductase-like NAD-dependent aldehyde dehydrogenase
METMKKQRDAWRAGYDKAAADEMQTALEAVEIACLLTVPKLHATERARLLAHYAARIDRDAQTLAQLRGE